MAEKNVSLCLIQSDISPKNEKIEINIFISRTQFHLQKFNPYPDVVGKGEVINFV